MKIVIDIKSALLGLGLGVAAMLAVGAGTNSSESGRYQIAAGDGGFAVMVDTQSGKAWSYMPINTAQWKTDGNFWQPK
jgi:hypothetical protein